MRSFSLARSVGIFVCLLVVDAAFAQKEPPAKDTDALPEGAIARYGSRRMRHDTIVYAVAFSADSKTLASAGGDGTIRLWDVSTGKGRSLPFANELMTAVVFFKDGKTLAAAGTSGTIYLVDAETGKEKHTLKGHAGGTVKIVLSGDEKKLFSCGRDATVREWDVENAKETRLLGRNPRFATNLALSADGKTLAVALPLDGVKLYDTEAGKELRQINPNKGQIESVAFTPDGKNLAVGSLNGPLALHDVETGKEAQPFKALLSGIGYANGVAFSPSGKVLASCGNQGVSLWGVTSGKEIRQLDRGYRGALDIAYSPDGTLVAVAERDGTLRLWNVETGQELHNGGGFSGAVQQIRYLADGKIIAVSGVDAALQGFRVLEAATGKEVSSLHSLGNTAFGHAWCVGADGKTIVSAGADRMVRWLDPLTGRETRRLDNFGPSGFASALAGDGRTIGLLLGNRTLQVSDVETGTEWLRFSAAANQTLGTTLVLSPDGRRAAVAGYDSVHLWDVPSAAELWKGAGTDRASSQLVFAPDGRTLAYSVGNQVRVMEVVSRQVRLQLDDPAGGKGPFIANRALAFSADGRLLAVATNGAEVALYDVPTGKELGRFKGHRVGVTALAFSPDGATLASGGTDATVIVWDAASLVKKNRPALTAPKEAEVATLWQDLTGDAAKVRPLLWSLTVEPDKTVAALKDKLKAVAPLDQKQIAKLINDLDDDAYATRQKASETLGGFPAAEADMRKALANNPSPEKKRRLEAALAKLEGGGVASDLVREARAVEVLEMLGTPAAKEVLEKLAKGAADATLTRECQAALDRLAKKVPAGR